MANPEIRQTLDIPNGTTFEFQDGKLVFGHESDIVIRTNLGGYKFQKIYSKKGSVQVIPPPGVEFDVEEIEALEGDLFLNGRVRVRSARARTVHFQEGALAADTLEATGELVLSGESLDVVRVKAPRVSLNDKAEGTVLVIECENDLGPCRVKGGFANMDEARAAFGRLEGAPAPAAAPRAAAEPAPSPETEASGTEDLDATVVSSSPQPQERHQTQEFRVPEGGSVKGEEGSAALPKSSVFRKRR